MGKHSIAEAEARLAELIDRALGGEEIVITRDGTGGVQLRPVPLEAPAQPLTPEDVDWLEARRVGRMPPEDAATLIRRMRDEEDY
jgi:antitoxin (DNA-binding transcriptional repressor) of toxin-antitoxin stability system